MNNISNSNPTFPTQQNNRQFSPKRQQWALINQYKALEYERLKEKERRIAQQKKQKFRHQLDNQLNGKNNVHQKQVEADKKYYQFITQQANQLKERQQRQKIQKIVKRRQIQQENNRLLEQTKNSRSKDQDTGYHLDIGLKSQLQRKRKTQIIKRDVLDTLDQQLRKKCQEREQSRLRQFQTDMKNLQYQNHYLDQRTLNKKQYGQNQRVYQYYQELQRQRKMKDLELEHKLIDEAAERQKREEEERKRREYMKRTHIKEEVKETLDQQVKAHNLKRFEQTKINPEQYSYGVIGNVFKERSASFDKHKYMEQLRKQAEEQKKKKQLQNYMSQEEYRLNMNQLNKIVQGQYAHDNYLDRSMGTIGDNKELRLSDIRDSIHDRDAEAVKYRLENLRQRNRSQIMSKTDRSF